jgi:mono/diheme cytochrome c family protein
MKKSIVRWIPLFVLVFLFSACTSATEAPLPTNTPVPIEVEDTQDTDEGEKQEPAEVVESTIDPQALWEENNCARCHGGNRQGGSSAPPLLPDTLDKEASVYIQTITDGKGRMPTFGAKMSSEEIGALVEWLMTVTP